MIKITCYGQPVLPGGQQHNMHTPPSHRPSQSITIHTNKQCLNFPISHTNVPPTFTSKIPSTFSIHRLDHCITSQIKSPSCSWTSDDDACGMVGRSTPQLIGGCVIGMRHRARIVFAIDWIPYALSWGTGNDVEKSMLGTGTVGTAQSEPAGRVHVHSHDTLNVFHYLQF